MAIMSFGPMALAAVLLLPAVGLAALAFLGDAPGEWAQGALIAWTGVASALLAGAALQSGASAAVWVVPILAVVAVMTGGPPGLVVAAVAALAALALPGLPVPRWLLAALAAPALAVVVRHYLA